MTLLLMVVAVAGAASAAAPPATPTAAATAPITILLSRPEAEPAPRGQSLAEVAKHIKLKLPANQPRVLTNASVKQLAEGVELTTAAEPPRGSGMGLPVAAGEDAKKAKWQQRYRAATQRVRRLEADVKALEVQVNGLERDFYSRDDVVYRDSTIKPAWDKALNDLEKARADLEAARTQPDEILDAARRDGALPGWFRGLDEEGPEAAPTAQASGPARVQPSRPAPRPTPTPRRQEPVGPS